MTVYKHLKSGRFYRFLGLVTNEADGRDMAHYEAYNPDSDGPKSQYIRPQAEFFDESRFVVAFQVTDTTIEPSKVFNVEVVGFTEDLEKFPIEHNKCRLARFGTNSNYPPLLFFDEYLRKGRPNQLTLRVEGDPYPVGSKEQMVIFRGAEGRLQCFALGTVTLTDAYKQGQILNRVHIVTLEEAESGQRIADAMRAVERNLPERPDSANPPMVTVSLVDLMIMHELLNKAITNGIRVPTADEVEAIRLEQNGGASPTHDW